MEVTAPTPSRWSARLTPIVCGCAMAGGAALVALNDPAASGSRFPPCVFHATTGLWCPGCGLTRGFHQLFNGHVASALSYNLFVPVVLVAGVVGWWSWARAAWGRPVRWRWSARGSRWLTVGMPTLIVTYGVLRNVPIAPFRSLAP